MERPNHRSIARLAGLCACVASLLALAQLPARAAPAPAVQQRERIEPAAAPTPDWLQRALRHGSGGLPPAPPTDDPHASALTVELMVVDPARGVVTAPLTELVVEVLIAGRDANDPPWTAVARVAADGTAAFARVPEGRPHVLVWVPDGARVPLVPDPARYGLLFEPFGDGHFPHLALDELQTAGSARTVQLHLVAGRAADGEVELDAMPTHAPSARPGDLGLEGGLAWVASPGWLQLAPFDEHGEFRWFDPRPAPEEPFDPAAPSAGFLERLIGGVAQPFGAAVGAWRKCAGVPAPPVGQPLVIELTLEDFVRRARGAEPPGPAAPTTSEQAVDPSPAVDAAALARWRALRATPLAPPFAAAPEGGQRAAPVLTRAERAALARTLLDPTRAREGIVRLIADSCRLALGQEGGGVPAELDMYVDQHELLELARQWLALGADGTEEAELALLDRAQSPVEALIDQTVDVFSSADVPLQLWIDVVAPRYPRYAEALAAYAPILRAPRRSTARGALPEGLAELDAHGLLEALRRRPSSTLGAELAPLVRAVPREAAVRLLVGFAALARDDARGPAVRDGAIDLLLALGERPAGDGGRALELGLAEIVLGALGEEPADVARTEAVLAALAPLAPARALADARAALDAFDAAASDGAAGTFPPPGALLVLAALAPEELAQRPSSTRRYATFAAAALLLEGRDAFDARGLPHAFLERLLR